MVSHSKIIITIVALLSVLLFALPVEAKNSAKIGGTFVNDTDSTFSASIDYSIGNLKTSYDYVYKESNNVKKIDKFNSVNKYNMDLNDKSYAFGLLSYDSDALRSSGDRTVVGAGYGYNILNNDKWDITSETSIAFMTNDLTDEAILRENISVKYKLTDKLEFSNKILYESGTETYLRNETDVSYLLGEYLTVGLSNTYTEDPIDNNVLRFNVGVKW